MPALRFYNFAFWVSKLKKPPGGAACEGLRLARSLAERYVLRVAGPKTIMIDPARLRALFEAARPPMTDTSGLSRLWDNRTRQAAGMT
jgi:hypothetical protein